MSDRTIKKVKVDPKGGMKIVYEIKHDGDVDKRELVSSDEPKATLTKSLEDLKPHLQAICQFTDEQMKNVQITGVSFSIKLGKMGAVIIAKQFLETSNSPLNLHSPILFEGFESDKDVEDDVKGPGLTPECVEALNVVIEEALDYLDRKRAPKPEQTHLFEQERLAS